MESLYAYVEVTKILFDTLKSLYMHIEFTKIYFDPFEPLYAYAEVTKLLFDTMESLYTYAYQYFISFQHKSNICYTTQILNDWNILACFASWWWSQSRLTYVWKLALFIKHVKIWVPLYPDFDNMLYDIRWDYHFLNQGICWLLLYQ